MGWKCGVQGTDLKEDEVPEESLSEDVILTAFAKKEGDADAFKEEV